MIAITVDKRGKRVLLDVPRHLAKHKDGMRQALHETGVSVRRETRRLIRTGPKTGRLYGKHRASAPGEAPATKTGALAKSVAFRVRSHEELVVGEGAPYAGFLEDGTKKMAPRPHLIAAINSTARDTEQALLRGVTGD